MNAKVIHIIEQTLIKMKATASADEATLIDSIIKEIRPLEQQYVTQMEKQMGEVTKNYKEKEELNTEKGVLVNNLRGVLMMVKHCQSCRSGPDRKTAETATSVLQTMTDPNLRRSLGKVTGI